MSHCGSSWCIYSCTVVSLFLYFISNLSHIHILIVLHDAACNAVH